MKQAESTRSLLVVSSAPVEIRKSRRRVQLVQRRRRTTLGMAIVCWVLASFAHIAQAQVEPSAGGRKPLPPPASKSAVFADEAKARDEVEKNPGDVTDAEKISGIGQIYEMDRRRLKELQVRLQKIDNEYKQAEKEFEPLDKTLNEMRERLKGEEDKPAAASTQKEIGSLEQQWRLAKDRFRRDPYYGDLILDDPEMLGVDSFGDSAVVIKFFIKTRPQRQFTVKRELLRRIKRRFDELGIEIPFPHRTVYHRGVENGPHLVETPSKKGL